MRRPVAGVMGSGLESHAELAEPLGRWLAASGFHLLTGGGRGVMDAVSRAFAGVEGRAGLVIGVLPGDVTAGAYATRPGYPNPHVELVIRTHLPLSGAEGTSPMSRNHVNVLSSDFVIALPGGAGTASEVALALRYNRPVVAFLGPTGAIPGLPAGVPVARELAEVCRFVAACV